MVNINKVNANSIVITTKTTSFWDDIVTKIENQDASLPAPSSSVVVPYKVDPNGEAVDTEWMILGYNKDIPRYVKYKD